MEYSEIFPPKTGATSLAPSGAQGDGDSGLLASAPFAMRHLLLPLPPTGSAVLAQAWTRQVLAFLLGRHLAQAWVAVAGAIDGGNELLRSRNAMSLLLLLASGKLESSAGLPRALPHRSVGVVGLLPRPYGKGQREQRG